ncbi:MAG: cupin domain-containing protein [Rhodobacteraceae bacterium]|nr:cupin domain-containing protein [Paracoccaceae bacterium]
MFAVNLSGDWEPVPQTEGLTLLQLSGDFDEPAQRGFRTRYVRFVPGGETFAPYTHSYWEEAYLLEGELTTKEDGVTLKAPAYVIRPPGTPHGPLVSHTGCLLLEVQYFADRQAGPTAYLDRKAPTGA